MLNGVTARLCPDQSAKKKWMIGGGVTAGLLIIIIIIVATTTGGDQSFTAHDVLTAHPLIDGHNDFPYKLFKYLQNEMTDFQFNQSLKDVDRWNPAGEGTSQTDLKRLQDGLVGGQFWAAYTPCDTNFKDAVSRTFEQIDVIKRLIDMNHDHLQLVSSVQGIREAFTQKRIASLIGVEGGHSIDSRLSVLRQLYAQDVRYMTLTHNCHLPWVESHVADSGLPENKTNAVKNGLTDWGKIVIGEMNRLGMIVDLSHTSKQTMLDAIATSTAPVIFSHSSAFGVLGVTRNVPDDVLELLKAKDGLVMINFGTNFVDPKNSTLLRVIDHIEYIRNKTDSVDHIGLGSDYDGTKDPMPVGLEDVSKFPDLFTALIAKGWTRDELGQLAGGNFLRVFEKVEQQRVELALKLPADKVIPLEDLAKFEADVSTCRSNYLPPTEPTVAPTEAPTVAPTEAPTVAPTVAPTEAPTEAPKKAPEKV